MIPQPLKIDPKWSPAIGDFDQLTPLHIGPDDGTMRIRFSRAEKRVLRKRKKIAPSAWAEKHRYLPRDAAVPGRMKLTTVPYAAGILDAADYKSVQEIVLCAAPQGAKTEIAYTYLGYTADRRPGNWLVVFPNENDAKDNSSDRILPMFNDSPRLRTYKTGYADDETGAKITLSHMRITMAWATSAARLANRPLPYVFLDEEDKYPPTVGKKEASPDALAEKRMRTFKHMRKKFRASSPTVESGPIWQALLACHLIFDFYVKCPICGTEQLMVFEQIKWTEKERDPKIIEITRDVWYQCEHCLVHWDDADRNKAVRAGRWLDRDKQRPIEKALDDEHPLKIGFHIPAWISPFVDMWECAAAFLKAQKGQPDYRIKLRDFKNGFEAKPWKNTDAYRDEVRILSLCDERERGVVPGNGQVACLLAGVDTHGLDDTGRLDFEIRAFGYGHNPTTWSIRNGHLTSFDAVSKVLWQTPYKDSDGNVYPVVFTCIDAMGRRTHEVYEFCRKYRGMIAPCQGKDKLSRTYIVRPQDTYPGSNKKIPGGIDLYLHHTNYLKNKLSAMLSVSYGDPGCWYFHKDLDVDWARQMCAEEINPETNMWENPKGRSNHAWDVSVLQLLAAEILDLWQYEPESESAEQAVNQKQVVAKSSFITGGR